MHKRKIVFLVILLLFIIISVLASVVIYLQFIKKPEITVDESKLPISGTIRYEKVPLNQIGYNYRSKNYYYRLVRVNEVRDEGSRAIVNLMYDDQKKLNQDFIVYEDNGIKTITVDQVNSSEVIDPQQERNTVLKDGKKEIIEYINSLKGQSILMHLTLIPKYKYSSCNRDWADAIENEERIDCTPGLWYFTAYVKK